MLHIHVLVCRGARPTAVRPRWKGHRPVTGRVEPQQGPRYLLPAVVQDGPVQAAGAMTDAGMLSTRPWRQKELVMASSRMAEEPRGSNGIPAAWPLGGSSHRPVLRATLPLRAAWLLGPVDSWSISWSVRGGIA